MVKPLPKKSGVVCEGTGRKETGQPQARKVAKPVVVAPPTRASARQAAAAAAGGGSSNDDKDDEDVFARRADKKRSAQNNKDTPAPKRAKVNVVTAQGPNFESTPEDGNELDDDDGGGGGGGPAFVANPALRGQPAVNEYFSTHKAESTRPTEEVLNDEFPPIWSVQSTTCDVCDYPRTLG